MAVTLVTTTMAAGVNYTVVTDTSADWASVANSTYFYDKADKLVHYKDSTGNIQEIFSGSGVTVGTTAVTSGTVGRVFFQGTGDVVQQDSALFYDNTNKRLGVGANSNSPSAALQVRTNVNTAHDLLQISNGLYGNGIFRIRDNATASQSSIGSVFIQARIYGSNSTVTGNEFDLGGYGLGSSYGDAGSNGVWLNNQGNVGDGAGTSVISVSSNVYINLQTTKKYKFEAQTGHFGIGNVGTLGARLDVRAQGALSTDVAFRVRNSADTADIFSIRGNNHIYFPQTPTFYYQGTTKSFFQINSTGGGYPFSNIRIGQDSVYGVSGTTVIGTEASANGLFGTTLIGSTAIANASGGDGVGIGQGVRVNGSAAIAIGSGAKSAGSYSIVIGVSGSNQTFGGTNSIYLGRPAAIGNSFTCDNVFMTFFNSANSSTLTRGNGSFGLLGQQAYIFTNGTGANGLTTFMGDGGNTLVVRNHPNIPSLNIVDSFQQYSADIVAGNAAPHFRTENGNIIKIYQETTGIAAAAFVSNTSLIVDDSATYGGYTMGQVVAALKAQGLLA